jgi:hypothetical protein
MNVPWIQNNVVSSGALINFDEFVKQNASFCVSLYFAIFQKLNVTVKGGLCILRTVTIL